MTDTDNAAMTADFVARLVREGGWKLDYDPVGQNWWLVDALGVEKMMVEDGTASAARRVLRQDFVMPAGRPAETGGFRWKAAVWGLAVGVPLGVGVVALLF